MAEDLLTVSNLVVEYGTGKDVFRAVDDVSFSVPRGGTLAIVGESGCGKSTIAKALVRLLKPTSGVIDLDGTDLAQLSEKQLRPIRHRVQMVFQDPYGSLDPHLTAQEIVAEPIAGARGEVAQGPARQGGRAHRPGRAAAHGARPQAPRVLRRPAPAHRHRPGARVRSRAARLRRGDERPRRVRAGAGARAARRPPGRDRA